MINECGCGCGGAVGGCMSGDEQRPESYMFFGNLQTIKRAVEEMMRMDPAQVDAILKDGHNWAVDHVATSKDDIEEVAGFLVNQMEKTHGSMKMTIPFIQTFESFVNEAKKAEKAPLKKATKKPKTKSKRDQDGDGDSDFADAKVAQYKAGGVPHGKAVSMSRKFNR